jgi:DNA-binding NarL/FixJ family response regulator
LVPRILIVDDHELVRKGISFLLNGNWDICGEAENGQDAVLKVSELKPDLVLLDLSMPIMGGTAAARQIRRVSPATKIVFLSMHESETVVELTRLAGADACLSKRCSPQDLNRAIATVLRDHSASRPDPTSQNPCKFPLRLFEPT